MSTVENERLVRAYIEAVWNKGNLDFIEAVWTADRVAECRAGWVSNHQFCPKGRFSIEDVIAQHNKVVVRWTFQGMHAWELKSPVERSITVTGISIWTIKDERLVDSHFASEGPGIYE